jgi:hypothetical protein
MASNSDSENEFMDDFEKKYGKNGHITAEQAWKLAKNITEKKWNVVITIVDEIKTNILIVMMTMKNERINIVVIDEIKTKIAVVMMIIDEIRIRTVIVDLHLTETIIEVMAIENMEKNTDDVHHHRVHQQAHK